MNEHNKINNNKKMQLFSNNVVHFGFFFANEMECKRGKQDFGNIVIVLNATSVLIFQYKNDKKTRFKKYYTISLFQFL